MARPNWDHDCEYPDSSRRAIYCWRSTTSEHDGALWQYLHTETAPCHNTSSPYTYIHDGYGACNYVSGPKWNLPNQSDFVVSFVARYDVIPGRKVAYLRWCGPRVGDPGYCEDNFPEAKLEGGLRGKAFHHLEGSSSQQAVSLNIDLAQWHLYQMHVKPCQYVDFILDGRTVLHATQGVTCDASYFVGQSETYLAGQAIPEPDNAGYIVWDEFAVDLPQ